MRAPLFHTAPEWQQLPGYLHGFQQPVLSGWIAVSLDQHIGADAVVPWVQAFFDEQIADASLIDSSPGQNLVLALMHSCGALQRLCGIPVERSFHTVSLSKDDFACPDGFGVFRAAMPCFSLNASIVALNWAIALFNDAAKVGDATLPTAEDIDGRLALARELLKSDIPNGVNRFGLVQAAQVSRMFCQPVLGGLYQFGTGAYARLVESSVTDRTAALGMQMAGNKWMTSQMLRRSALPAPRQYRVATEQDAVHAAAVLGYPVVVKPEDQEQGRGVAADLISSAQVVAAFQAARKLSARILVEQHVDGNTHRLTVVEGEVIRVTRRHAGGVVGDGQHNVATLLAKHLATEAYQRRARRLGKALLALDEEALGLLQQKGLSAQSIPAEGQSVRLRRRDNINAGGTNTEIEIDQVHPANLELAINAARLLRLDYAGVDLISCDITQPWWSNGASICEVNARPQLAARNSETRYYEHILRCLMGPKSHIPVHLELVLQTSAVGSVVARCLSEATGCVASPQGLHIGGGSPAFVMRNGFEAAQVALRRPDVHALTIVLTLDELQAYGLPLPSIDTLRITGEPGVVTDVWPPVLIFALPHVKTILPLNGSPAAADFS